MTSRKRPRFPVSTSSILQQIRHTARKVKQQKKTASDVKLRQLNLELEVLRHCYSKLGNIKPI